MAKGINRYSPSVPREEGLDLLKFFSSYEEYLEYYHSSFTSYEEYSQYRHDIETSSRTLNCFSDYSEYKQFMFDFYQRPWCSVHLEISTEHPDNMMIDLADTEYLSSNPEEIDSLSGCDDGEGEEFVEESYVKDRSRRMLRRRNTYYAKKRAFQVTEILYKKSLKQDKEAPTKRYPSKNFDDRFREYCKHYKHLPFPKADNEDVIATGNGTTVQEVRTTSGGDVSSHEPYFNRTVQVATSAKQSYGKMASVAKPATNMPITTELLGITVCSIRYLYGRHLGIL